MILMSKESKKSKIVPIEFSESKDRILVLVKDLDSCTKSLLALNFEPFLYTNLKEESIKKLKVPFLKLEKVKRTYFGKEVELTKVYFPSISAFYEGKNILKKNKVIFFEADFPLVKKCIHDTHIKPLYVYEKEDSSENPFNAHKVKSIVDSSKLNVLAFDIETYGDEINFEKNPILMISLYGYHNGKAFKKVISWVKDKKNKSPSFVSQVSSEKELLMKFVEYVNKFNPDILVGYSSDNFDFPYILKRAEINSIDVLFNGQRPSFRRSRRPSVHVPSFVHIDLFKVVRSFIASTLKTDSYDLNSVAMELLGEGKEKVNLSDLSNSWQENDLNDFYYYNLKDSKITFKLFNRILPNLMELVSMTHLPLFDVSRMSYSQIVEWHLIFEAKKRSILVPNKPNHNEILLRAKRSYEGAFVFQPKPGIYDRIIIFDFKSLYPTIIDAHNISPDSLRCSCCKNKKESHVPGFDEYWFCLKKRGLIPEVIKHLIEERTELKKKIKESKKVNLILKAREQVLKRVANSMYGYMGFFGSRWYCFECVESITAYGRHYITRVIGKAEKEGFKVIYSDTDSIFISLGKKTKNNAKNFVDSINKSLPSMMHLSYQGFYPRGLFVSAKLSSTGAKKKYALLNENGTLKFVGLELVRRNYCPLAKEVQEKVISLILKDRRNEEAVHFIKQVIDKLNNREIPNEKLILKTQLQKATSSYSSNSPHVVLAKKMKSEGFIIHPGMIIEYVVKPGKGRISDRAELPSKCKQGKYDSSYYINNQILPVVDNILQLIGHSKKEFLGGNKSLSNFF